MQTRSLHRAPSSVYVEEVYPYVTAQNVSTLTTLLNWTDLGSDYSDLAFQLDNTDASNTCTLIVEASQGGTRPNDRQLTYTVPASKEGSLEIAGPNLYTYYRVTAQTASPSFPTVSIRWAVIGRRR
jgi:hypothetical protein